MLVPDENLAKCTLLVQRSPQALIDYQQCSSLPSPLHSSDKACKRETRYDYECTKYYQTFFLWKENKISLVYIKLFVI